MKKRIAITTTSFGKYDEKPLSLLKKSGFEIILNTSGRKLKKEEISVLCRGAVGIIAGTELIDARVLELLPGLRVISRCGSGLDNVDREASSRLGIKVMNTPAAPVQAVAELTVGLFLDLLRRVSYADRKIRAGVWEKPMGNLLKDKKIGIIGFGNIGKAVNSLVRAFGCETTYADPGVEKSRDSKRVSLDKLLRESDIVTIHVSGRDRILDNEKINLMKKDAWLVKASRGGTVDEDALCGALKKGRISGAAIDVFEREPYEGPLRELDNVVLTPHMGSYAKEARVNMEIESVKNLLKGLEE